MKDATAPSTPPLGGRGHVFANKSEDLRARARALRAQIEALEIQVQQAEQGAEGYAAAARRYQADGADPAVKGGALPLLEPQTLTQQLAAAQAFARATLASIVRDPTKGAIDRAAQHLGDSPCEQEAVLHVLSRGGELPARVFGALVPKAKRFSAGIDRLLTLLDDAGVHYTVRAFIVREMGGVVEAKPRLLTLAQEGEAPDARIDSAYVERAEIREAAVEALGGYPECREVLVDLAGRLNGSTLGVVQAAMKGLMKVDPQVVIDHALAAQPGFGEEAVKVLLASGVRTPEVLRTLGAVVMQSVGDRSVCYPASLRARVLDDVVENPDATALFAAMIRHEYQLGAYGFLLGFETGAGEMIAKAAECLQRQVALGFPGAAELVTRLLDDEIARLGRDDGTGAERFQINADFRLETINALAGHRVAFGALQQVASNPDELTTIREAARAAMRAEPRRAKPRSAIEPRDPDFVSALHINLDGHPESAELLGLVEQIRQHVVDADAGAATWMLRPGAEGFLVSALPQIVLGLDHPKRAVRGDIAILLTKLELPHAALLFLEGPSAETLEEALVATAQ